MNITERKKEIIGTCLETFMRDGLLNTSMRDLGKALDLDPTALYNHFENKDEVVIACAEEATIRIENELFVTAYKYIENPPKLAEKMNEMSVTLRPLLQFFINVCTSQKYCDKLKDVRYRQGDRYRFYIDKIAKKLGCDYDDVAPLFYTVANTMISYMIYSPDNFSAPQLKMVRDALVGFLKNRNKE